MRILEDANGRRHAERCSCRLEKRTRKLVEQARIPRYEHCTLDAYESSFSSAHASIPKGLQAVFARLGTSESTVRARRPVEETVIA